MSHLKSFMPLFFCILSAMRIAASDIYPLRERYETVKPISTSELHESYNDFMIVDVRSKFEFDVIHIRKALHAPIAITTFKKALKVLTKGNKHVKIAFYCNGYTCAKSYKAAMNANAMGYANTFVYDAGIFEWIKAFPDQSTLMGKSPADLAQLISDDKLEKHFLDRDAFKERCAEPSSLIIDARDPIQIKNTPDFGKKAENLPLDKLVRKLSSEKFHARVKGKTLLIYDAVGKQVRWLQYHLEGNGYSSYYFLKKGVWSIYGENGAN